MSEIVDIRSLITYVISKLDDMEASFGKTKLVKLLYLIDVEFYRLCSRKLTGFEWVFYYYGPYASAVDNVLTQLDLDIPQEDVKTLAGYKARVFKAPKHPDTKFEEKASDLEKLIVDKVLREWGMAELNPLLSYAYFHTEPMKDAHRGEILDFSTIKRPPPESRRQVTETPAVRIKELQKNFQKIKESRPFMYYESMNPKPRFDEVFWSGLMGLTMDEMFSTPSGDIDLTDEFKDKIQKLSENE